MTVRELIEKVIYLDSNYLDYEIKYYHKTQENIEITVPINAIGISNEKELLLSEKCPLCDD